MRAPYSRCPLALLLFLRYDDFRTVYHEKGGKRVPYAVYLRKSRKDEEAEMQGAGETLSRHRETLLNLAKQRGYDIGRIYSEIGSADSIAGRPVMQQLLDDVQDGMWEGVLVYDVARLARGDTMDQGRVAETFRYSTPPTRIITPERVYDPENEADEEYFEFGLFFARREYKHGTRRMQAGRTASGREGKYAGSVDPYGYHRYKLKGEKGWSLSIVPEEAEFVRMMYAWAVNGRDTVVDGASVHEEMGATKIADALNALGSRTGRGNPWTTSSVRVVLHNPVYAGKVHWFKREKKVQIVDGKRISKRPLSDKYFVQEGRHDAIIPQDLWDAAQLATTGRNRPSVHKSKQTMNPLAGLVKCSECGKAMVRTPMYGHLAGVDYLKCSTTRCPTSACPLSDVENMVLESIASWVEDAQRYDAALPSASSSQDDSSSLLAAAQARLDELKKRRARLMDLLESGVYDAATYAERNALLIAELKEATAALEAIPERVPSIQERLVHLLPQLKHVLEAYDAAATPADKNKLLRSVVERVVYHKTHACNRDERPGDFVSLDVFPKV